jgi:hypothetical protein
MNWTPNDDIDDSGVIARAKATEYYLFLVELTFAPHNIRFRDNRETKNCPEQGTIDSVGLDATSDGSHLAGQ